MWEFIASLWNISLTLNKNSDNISCYKNTVRARTVLPRPISVLTAPVRLLGGWIQHTALLLNCATLLFFQGFSLEMSWLKASSGSERIAQVSSWGLFHARGPPPHIVRVTHKLSTTSWLALSPGVHSAGKRGRYERPRLGRAVTIPPFLSDSGRC